MQLRLQSNCTCGLCCQNNACTTRMHCHCHCHQYYVPVQCTIRTRSPINLLKLSLNFPWIRINEHLLKFKTGESQREAWENTELFRVKKNLLNMVCTGVATYYKVPVIIVAIITPCACTRGKVIGSVCLFVCLSAQRSLNLDIQSLLWVVIVDKLS